MTVPADIDLDGDTLAALEDLLEPEQVQALVIDHLTGSQERRLQMIALLQAGDMAALGRVAHDIISTSANFGMAATRDTARRTEIACKAGATSLSLEEAAKLIAIMPQQLQLLAARYDLPWPPPPPAS